MAEQPSDDGPPSAGDGSHFDRNALASDDQGTQQAGQGPGRRTFDEDVLTTLDDDTYDTIHHRMDFLRAIGAGAGDRTALQEELELSRSTVDRGVRDLQRLGLILQTETGYRLTVTGRVVLATNRTYLERLDATLEVADLLSYVPLSAPIDGAILDGADVVRNRQPGPSAPTRRVVDIVERADAIRGLTAENTHPDAFAQIRRRILQDGLDAEFVIDDRIVEYFSRESSLDDLIASDRLRLSVTDGLPYGLFVTDDGRKRQACLILYDDTPSMVGVIVNDAPDSVAWADRVIDRYSERARPVDSEE